MLVKENPDRKKKKKVFGNKQNTAGRNTQAMDDCKFSYQNKYRTLQRMKDCHSFCDKKRSTTSSDGWLQLER